MTLPRDLPIAAVLDDISAALADPGSAAVIVAPPGAGKSTIVPLVLESQSWCSGKIIVVEPRRVATRAAATRMAALRNERIGQLVGWRMRDDTKVSRATRIEVVTEGVLTRMLHSDPALAGVSAVVFDEFHERSLDADLGLAFTLDARAVLHPDLRVVAMSATLDGAAVARILDDAPIIECVHRQFPVTTRYLASPSASFAAEHVAEATRLALREGDGNVLVFAPGIYEIGQVVRALHRANPDTAGVEVLPLHGSLRAAEQDRVLAATPSRRRVIVATSIAETSLTIDGVTAVVDAGFARIGRFDPRRGMGGLTTVRVSRASADQRRGRAGRTAPGRCYRLWSELEHERLRERAEPEIAHADLAGLALDLVRWGDPGATTLRFLDLPPAEGLQEGQRLLHELGMIDTESRLTDHGRRSAELPLHPRLAHCVVRGYEMGHGTLACAVAALLSERTDGTKSASVDLAERLDDGRLPPATARRAATIARRVRSVMTAADTPIDAGATGLVLALAYPDRVARRRAPAGSLRYLLANGVGAVLPPHDPLATSEWIAIADVEARPQDARIFVAAAVDRTDVERLFADRIVEVDDARWDVQAGDVRATRDRRLGAIVVSSRPFDDPAAVRSALLDGVAREGLHLLARIGHADTLRDRVAFARRVVGGDWPDLSDDTLLASLETWLAPQLGDARRRADLDRVDVARALQSLVPRALFAQLDSLAPRTLTVPSGSRVEIDYGAEQPAAHVRLQEVFGWSETPRVGGGRIPVVLHLLSPAGRPVQVTADLDGFWRGSYPQVRAEMRGRYPKHDWPLDPTHATPSRGVKRARRAP